MASESTRAANRQLETLFRAGATSGLTDGQLLERFTDRRRSDDARQAAFETIVARHGGMILQACRRILGDDHDAQEAAQATLLVFALRAGSIGRLDSVGGWLHGVATRVAAKARVASIRRRARERRGGELAATRMLERQQAHGGAADDSAFWAEIHEELGLLPEKFRAPLVLCYLEGLTQQQAADQLRWPLGTVQSRLARGRERLRIRLTRRGLAPSAALAVPLFSTEVSQAAGPAALASSTAGVAMTAGEALAWSTGAFGGFPVTVKSLAEGVVWSMFLTKLKMMGMAILLMVGVIATVAAVYASQAAEPDAPANAPAAKAGNGALATPTGDGRFEIQAVAAATGKPLEGVTVVWQLRINNGRYNKTKSSTDGEGRAVLEWPRGATVNGLQLTAQKAGFVPYLIRWDDNAHPLSIPAVRTLRFVPGIPIGGLVEDEAGESVAGAKITVNAPPTDSDASYYRFAIAETTADAQGRWRVDDAPAGLIGVTVTVQAPRFLRAGGTPSRDLDAVTVLKRGFTVKGRVIDTQGKPVVGAKVSGGDSWSSEPEPTKTDARGEFVLENCPPGASLVTVQAEGFAPDLREIHSEDQPTLEFLLGPGHTLSGKVVDRQGKPVVGALVGADTWRAHRSLDFRVSTGKDGRFEWRGAPGDEVLCGVMKAGYMARRRISLTPDDAEQVVTLDPELVISGRVTDASTGKPVPAFHLVQGQEHTNNPRLIWVVQDKVGFTDGRYTVRYTEHLAGYAVRIEAAGYKPAESRIFRPGEIRPTFDVSMTRAAASDLLTGTVVRSDGQPANGAVVALATRDHPLLFESEQVSFSHSNGMSFAKTGPDGRFTFDLPDGPFLLAAMSDDGYAESREKSGTIALQAWGKVVGQAFIGRQPAAGQVIRIDRRNRQPEPNGVNAFYGHTTRTDAQGRFVFERVMPGEIEVSRVVVTEFGNGSSQHMGCWQEPVDLAPGETREVRIGGKGRAVIGRVALQAAPGVHVDWRQNRPATVQRAQAFGPIPGLLGPDPRQNDRFAGSFDKDGRFRVDDVPAGHYELTITIDAPPVADHPGPVEQLGRVKVPIDVPEGDDVPVDIGEIKAEVMGR